MTTRQRTLAALLTLLFAPVIACAQTPLSASGPDLFISANPTNPGPHQIVSLTLQAALADLSASDITWTVNGAVVAEGIGQTQAEVTTGDAGAATTIVATASSPSSAGSATLTLTPASVDLLFDAASYVPPFYMGRSLPSPMAPLRVEAVSHLLVGGSEIPGSQLTYTWKQDGRVLGSLSGVGKSSALLSAPPLFGATDVSVEVHSLNGASAASASAHIPATDPGIVLYVDHPLFGIEYYHAVAPHEAVSETEQSFVAVPYFMSAQSPDDSNLVYNWQINNQPVAASTTASEITISAAGASGLATLSLELTSNTDYYLDAKRNWILDFGSGSSFGTLGAPQTTSSAFQQ